MSDCIGENVEVDKKKPWIYDATLDTIRHKATTEDPLRHKVQDERVKKAAKTNIGSGFTANLAKSRGRMRVETRTEFIAPSRKLQAKGAPATM
ncbi:MAG: hypothetical protein CME32_14980 [Gimesia sp.]|nr:hypothetical protein [Gimesia sp.]